MARKYSQEVEEIFNEWLLAIESSQGIDQDDEIIKRIRQLISEGKIYSQQEIKKLVDNYGKQHVTKNQ